MVLTVGSQLLVGFEEMDAQHRALFDRMNAAVARAEADDLPGTKAALRALADGLLFHFGAEESFMEESLYPERQRHRSAHELFMQDFAQLSREVETMGLIPPVVEGIVTRVPEWLKFHIQVNDVPLARFLASKRYRPGARGSPRDKPRTV